MKKAATAARRRQGLWCSLLTLLTVLITPAANAADVKTTENSQGGNSKAAATPERQPKTKTRAQGLPSQFTSISLTNGTLNQQYFYITLTPVSGTVTSYPTNEEITNINQITFTGTSLSPGEGVINSYNGSTLQGYFFLNSGTTVTYTPNLTFSAQIYTNGTAGNNNSLCITNGSQGSGIGATLAEVTLNVDSQYLGGETVDISEVNGVNSLWEMTLPLPSGNLAKTPPSGSYPAFFCSSALLFPAKTTVKSWGTFSAGQYIPVPIIINRPGKAPIFSGDANGSLPFNAGKGTVGVYPFGCDLCTSRSTPGCTATYPAANLVQQSKPVCQVMRSAQYQTGGTVAIKLKSFPYPH